MLNWIQNVLSHETKASLRNRIKAQEETIAMLMSPAPMQLAKLAMGFGKIANHTTASVPECDCPICSVRNFVLANADALRCLETANTDYTEGNQGR